MINLKTNFLKYKDGNGVMQDSGMLFAQSETDVSLTKSGVAADAKIVGEQIENIENQINDLKENGTAVDLTGVATETYVKNYAQPKGNYLTSIPSEYVTESELTAKKYLTQHQDISGKADKSSAETWTFTLLNGSKVTKKVVVV